MACPVAERSAAPSVSAAAAAQDMGADDLAQHVQAVVAAIPPAEHDTVTFKDVQAMLRGRGLSEALCAAHKRAIKELFREALSASQELHEIEQHTRDMVLAMSADERETLTFKMVKAHLQEHGVAAATIAAQKDAIKATVTREIDRLESTTPATAKQTKKKRSREQLSSEEESSDAETRKKAPAPKDPPRVWDAETEKLKALVLSLGKGIPKHMNFRLPVNVYRKDGHRPATDAVVQERIKAFLRSKGLKTLTPNNQEIASFQKKFAMDFELNGIDTSNIVESAGRPRRAAATAFLEAQATDQTEEASDDEESLLAAPLKTPAPMVNRYNLADSDSD